MKRWALIAAVAAIAAVIGGPFVYFRFVQGEQPSRLVESTPNATVRPASSGTFVAEGTWKVTSGSKAGYRVKEILFGQSGEAVGRTEDVTGTIEVAGTTVTKGSFTVDMTTVRSDEERRDNQFRGRIMNVAQYPTATFVLTSPIEVGAVPADGTSNAYTIKGKLTMHGVTRDVTIEARGTRSGETFNVTGELDVRFADYGINNPSGGPAQTGDDGVMEFSINFERA